MTKPMGQNSVYKFSLLFLLYTLKTDLESFLSSYEYPLATILNRIRHNCSLFKGIAFLESQFR